MVQRRRPTRPSRELGPRVRALREERGWSQERLAERAGLHPTYVSSVERGERNVTLLSILRLAEALRADAGELVSGIRLAR